ncbi:hypothetical protein AALB_2154 [Agarivorans albus MKT 106]|uniref:Uncharacterized protein n=1 Tax=Agarivorans albus MKT 106 TaxID=1331007 RepID=R9PL16_AGAAL|nr:hypothetical protein AALB_2154 [Agarivorans albus MKT 106]
MFGSITFWPNTGNCRVLKQFLLTQTKKEAEASFSLNSCWT